MEQSQAVQQMETVEKKGVEQQPAITQKRAPRRKTSKKSDKIIIVKSKRKSAVARASLRTGSGIIRINSKSVDTIEQEIEKSVILEPINLSSITKEQAKGLDINITVYGGGRSAQAQAIRSAIAKGIAKFSDTDTIKKEYMRFDRNLLVDDYRRVEPKKFKGPKARARFQTSYR